MNNIFVLDKNYNKIGTLSNQGVKPLAPYYNDLFVQELETGADTYEFSTISNSYTQGCIEIGNHIMFAYKNRNELFTITSIEYSHNEGYKTVGVYAEGLNFELLDIFMEKPKTSGSSGGTDNDNDGDDNYDDEYADVDDIYIDENGNIIYDKDGSGLGDVTIDGDGNIIYKRSKRKDGTGDSLEFNNISYPTFIKMMLKGTDWSYVCQPGLESNKQDMRVSYDKNIYAILQDSMQTYRGVELEFRYEYNNGKVIKTVYAYNDGGRGSFVGKRFEYGTNVKGITKMQEVTHEKEDAIIFVDDIGVEVTYDVDFALKSAEITDIEIGDTHYVIDNDFHPPMQIKARIGKIEISFSDPTRNKMYLANNKKIRGAVEEIEDVIDERIDNVDDDPIDGDHTHDMLLVEHYEGGSSIVFLNYASLPGPYECPLTKYTYDSRMYLEPQPYGDTYSAIGSESIPWHYVYARHIKCQRLNASDVLSITSRNIDNTTYINTLGIQANRYMMKATQSEFENVSTMSTKDLYNLINKLTIYKYTHKRESDRLDDGNSYTFGIFADDYANGSDSTCGGIFRNLYEADSSGNMVKKGAGYIENALLCALIGAFQEHVGNGTTGGANPDAGNGSYGKLICESLSVEREDGFSAKADIYGDLYVKNKILSPYIIEANIIRIAGEITFPDGSKLTSANGLGGGGDDGTTPAPSGSVFDTITVRKIQGPDPGEGQYNRVQFEDGICVDHIFCAHPDTGAIHMQDELVLHNGLELYGDLDVDGNIYAHNFPSSDISLKENIRYIDAASTTDDLEKTDLYDFIVNQVNLCEYNFIGDTADKIGFIANEYEGTKVGDKIVARNKKTDLLVYDISNLLFATIGALQEEVRIKDEKIASLEDRLARIEAMLGINNDN